MLQGGHALAQLVGRVAGEQPAPGVEAQAVLGPADRLPGLAHLPVELPGLQQPLVGVLARPVLGKVARRALEPRSRWRPAAGCR